MLRTVNAAMKNLNDGVKNFIRENYDLNQLMQVIMAAPGAAIKGETQVIVNEAIDEATYLQRESAK